MTVRDCSQDDIPFMLELGNERYAELEEGYEPEAAERWLRAVVGAPAVIAVRGEESCAIAFIVWPTWTPSASYCDLGAICARKHLRHPLEPLRLLRAIDTKRRERGCSRFYIHSSFTDLAPFARRLGAVPLTQSYVVLK